VSALTLNSERSALAMPGEVDRVIRDYGPTSGEVVTAAGDPTLPELWLMFNPELPGLT
jgi:hypothetical protein